VLVPGGVCAASFWQLPGYFKFAAAAIGALPVGAPPVPTWGSFVNRQPGDAWDDGGFVERVLAECGFKGVDAQLVTHVTEHASADAFVDAYGGMVTAISTRSWNDEEKAKFGPMIVPAFLAKLKENFGDGTVRLEWVAWCVSATKPESSS
jgi:hypothetical protein